MSKNFLTALLFALYQEHAFVTTGVAIKTPALCLFGSVARGTSTSESDIDILIVVLNEDKFTRDIIIEAAVDTNLIYDVVISPVIMSEKRFKGPLFQETSFYQSVQREGIPL